MASLKKVYIKIFLGVSVLGIVETFASSFEEKVGDINVTATAGSKAIGRADHVTTDSLTQNQGGRGGDNHFQITVGGTSLHAERERTPHEYFSEGEEFLRVVPPDYSRAAESFLKASVTSEQDMKVEAYLKYAECISIDNPSKASTYFEKVLKLQPLRDEAFRGLMTLDYDSSRDAEDSPEYLKEILIRASGYGNQIRRKNKGDRGLLKEITTKLSELSVKNESLRSGHLSSFSKKEGDSSYIDGEDIARSSCFSSSKAIPQEKYDVRGGEANALQDATGGNAMTTRSAAKGGGATSKEGRAQGGNAFANQHAEGGGAKSASGSAIGGNAIAGNFSAEELKKLKELGLL